MSIYALSEEKTSGFYFEKINNVYSWTLTSVLGDLLYRLENEYGKRDTYWTIIGVEFHDSEIPYIWYPGCRDHVAIALSKHARNNTKQAVFQLAHEAVHLLSPTGGQKATVMEEGLATIFSEEISNENSLEFNVNDALYIQAASLTREFLSIKSNSIKELREIEPKFSSMTPEMLCSISPNTSVDLAINLCTPFNAWQARCSVQSG